MAGRPGAVENSPYRKEIEEMLTEGKPDTDIAHFLKEKGHPISRQTINTYKNTKFNIPVEVRKEYNKRQSKKRLNKAKDKQVNDLEWIDKFLGSIDPENLKKGMEAKDQAAAANKFLNTKYKILGVIDTNKQVNVNVNNHVRIPTDPADRARGRDFIQSIRAGQMESSESGDGG